MADLNSLLRWAVENSTSSQNEEGDERLALNFRPANATSSDSNLPMTLHPSDPLYPTAVIAPESISDPTSLRNAENVTPTTRPANELSTAMLDLIMGKSDSVVMKEKMEIATEASRNVAERVEALDDFEMLIEMIDNANNMGVLKLWQPLLSLLSSPHQDIVRHSLWICGTAVQNNLKAQAALYINNLFPPILALVRNNANTSSSTRAKAVYALSSALKHWPLAASALSSSSNLGYAILREGAADPDPIIRRKVAFLIGALITQSSEKYDEELPGEVLALVSERLQQVEGPEETLLQGLNREGVIASLLSTLVRGDDDVEFDENAMRALVKAADAGALSEEEKASLRKVWTQWGPNGQKERDLDGQYGYEVAQVLG